MFAACGNHKVELYNQVFSYFLIKVNCVLLEKGAGRTDRGAWSNWQSSGDCFGLPDQTHPLERVTIGPG